MWPNSKNWQVSRISSRCSQTLAVRRRLHAATVGAGDAQRQSPSARPAHVPPGPALQTPYNQPFCPAGPIPRRTKTPGQLFVMLRDALCLAGERLAQVPAGFAHGKPEDCDVPFPIVRASPVQGRLQFQPDRVRTRHPHTNGAQEEGFLRVGVLLERRGVPVT